MDWTNFFKLIKEKNHWIQYLLLTIIIWIGSAIRLQGTELLKNISTGTYIPQALDPYYFLRIAEMIVQKGTLPAMDLLRSAPIGQPLSLFGSTMSYFLVWFHKLINIFSDISIGYSTIIFPVVLMALSTTLLFFLIKKLTNWKIATISSLILNIIPPFLHRTNVGFSDHDILGIFFLLLTLYLFIQGWQNKKIIWKIILGIMSGLTAVIGSYVAGNTAIAVLIIGSIFAIKTLWNKLEDKEIYFYLSWIFGFSFFSLIFGGVPSLTNKIISASGIILYPISIILLTKLMVEKTKLKIYFDKIKLNKNLKHIITGLIISAILLLIFAGPEGFSSAIERFFQRLLSSFSSTRHVTTVAENQPLTFNALISNFSTTFIILASIGTTWIFSNTIKKHKHKKTLVYSFIALILVFFITKIKESTTFLILGIIAIISFLIYYFIKHKSKETIKLNNNYLLILMWVIILTYAVSAAARLTFEFSIIMSIAGAFAIVSIIEYIIKERKITKDFKKNTVLGLKIGAIIIFAFILLSPFGFYKGTLTEFYETTENQAKYIGPGMNQQWQMASTWGKENLSEKAIFAHWWDYGYWVQYGFERPTITDGGNQINFWNYLMGRDVLTAPNFETPLKFLKSHNATHLLIISDEIGKYGAYSLIGSDENMDRFSQIQTFKLDSSLTEEKRNQTIFTYRGGIPLDEDFIYEGVIYPKGQAGIMGVRIPMAISNGNIQEMAQPTIILINGNHRKELTLQCLYVNNQEIVYPEYQFPGCFRMIPVWLNQQQNNQIGAGIFLSKKTYNTLFSKLFLLNQKNKYYKEVYNDRNNFPLSIFQGRLIGPLKIWEIQYPTNFKLTEKEIKFNLATSFEEVGLRSRK